MVLETNLVGGMAMWLDIFKAWLIGGFYLPNWEREGGSTYPYAQLTPPSPKLYMYGMERSPSTIETPKIISVFV